MSTLTAEFERLTRRYFAFLGRNFGFAERLINVAQVRYETKSVYVLVGYDFRRSYELSVDLGSTSMTMPSFNLGEVLRYAKAPSSVASSYQATSVDVLDGCIEKLAQALWKYGVDFLRNDQRAFAQLANLRAKESERFELESQLRNARIAAEIAWQKKDYAAVVAALAPFIQSLSSTEKKRLEYAKKAKQAK